MARRRAYNRRPNPLGTYGTVGRDALRGPGTVNFDAAVSRIFKMTERFSLQARLDAFNVLKSQQLRGRNFTAGTVTGYSTLSTNMSSSTFGRIQAAFDPRILQLSMKLFF